MGPTQPFTIGCRRLSLLKTMIPIGCCFSNLKVLYRARIWRPFKELGYRFPAWRAGTKTLFVELARQDTWAGEIDSSESIPGLHKRLQIRALYSRQGLSYGFLTEDGGGGGVVGWNTQSKYSLKYTEIAS